jgi:hypothetical protein
VVPVLLPEPVLPEPMLPEPVLPEPVLPEPMPPVDGVAGTELPLVEPLVVPLAPAPAPALFSLMHFSCSVPIRPTHFAGTSALPDAPDAAEPEVEPEVLPLAAGAVVLEDPPAEPEVLPLAAGAVVLEDAPVEPDADLSPAAIAVVERANNAAAVAAVRAFNII